MEPGVATRAGMLLREPWDEIDGERESGRAAGEGGGEKCARAGLRTRLVGLDGEVGLAVDGDWDMMISVVRWWLPASGMISHITSEPPVHPHGCSVGWRRRRAIAVEASAGRQAMPHVQHVAQAS